MAEGQERLAWAIYKGAGIPQSALRAASPLCALSVTCGDSDPKGRARRLCGREADGTAKTAIRRTAEKICRFGCIFVMFAVR